MLRMQLYDFKIKYIPGKYLYLAHTLSRAYQTDIYDAKINQDLVQVVHSLIINLPVTTTKLDEIQQATKNDEILQKVKNYCQTRWPRDQKNVCSSVQPY